jgi:pimeloyl-ACP methyl ester carboxylesterase
VEIERDGVRVSYDVAGDGPAILLTHGFAASARMFDANVDSLARDHTVVTWDLRGHGRSDSPTDPAAYSTANSVGDMVALLDAVGAERAVVAGHSLGGYLSLELHLAHPERVEALVLVGTGPGFRRDEPRAEWNRLAERYAVAFSERGLDALGDSEELDAGAHRDASGLVLAARHLLPQHDARVIDSLPSVDVPTLVVVGERDRAFLGGCRYLADKIPDARLVVVPDAGHAPNVSQPAVFDAELARFLGEVSRARGPA